MRTPFRTDCERFHRRDFLKVGAAGLLGLSLVDALRQEARPAPSTRGPRATGVILIWLGGGPATIDMWDLKPLAPEIIRGDFKPIATKVPGLSICEHLPKTAAIMHRCALVRSLQHGITAHGPGTLYMATGHPPAAALEYPSLGSLAARVLPPPAGVPPYLLFSQVRGSGFTGGAGFLGPAYNPFEVEASTERVKLRVEGISLPDGFTLDQLAARKKLRDRFDARFKALDEADLPASLDRFQQQALDILRSDKTRRAFDLAKETDARRESYGRTPFGQSVLTARRLIEAGARFVTVGLGGWDTHAANFRTLQNQLLPQLDRALSALIGDLDTRGLLETTIVFCAGEFGRTPRVNNAAGRDHWARSMAVFLAGGSLRPGTVYGSTDAHGMAPVGDPCSPADVAATIFHVLGIEPDHIVHTTSGRPMSIFREGKLLEALL
ncbi:MAG TPA: DUF1501 domain-containing protein [Gemmataceae bacterium]|nr:DUF1501 domain-containing protein [Gemmataceae bacterium]